MSDTISRQAAIDALREEVEFEYDEKDEQWYYIEADMAIGAIERLPSAQPERKKGKWILTEDDNYEYCTCSECGYQNGENWMNGSDIPFCAVCGADMRGESDD